MTEKALDFEALHIGVDDVSWQMGYRDAQPDERVVVEVRGLLDEVSAVVVPRFCYVVKWGTLGKGSLDVDGVHLSIGTRIARQLSRSEAFAFFVATAGKEYESFQGKVAREGDLLRVFIADALGSLIAERCADLMERSLQESIEKLDWKHTNRFSPGYCNWHVSEQPLLFSLIGEKPCGILLNEGCLMTPIKSVSGIVGVGHDVERLDYACALCGKKDCLFKHP
ncbi:MAG: methionine synthase [Prevotella sp.]|nr:methionine synthase [Prevotella sp.]